MDWYNTTLWPDLRPVFWNLVRTPPEKRDMALVKSCLRGLSTNFQILDGALARQDYLGGSAFSMGDIPLGLAAFHWYNLDIERPALSNLDAWYARLCSRPAFQAHGMAPLT